MLILNGGGFGNPPNSAPNSAPNTALNTAPNTQRNGQEVHKLYKINKVVIKEYKGIKGIRPDFVDFQNHKIYELKPYNPWGVRRGIRQLDKYKTVFDSKYSVENGWESIIVFY